MNKDPHQPISIMKCHRGFDHCSIRLAIESGILPLPIFGAFFVDTQHMIHTLGVFEVGHPDIVKLGLLRIELQMLSIKKPVRLYVIPLFVSNKYRVLPCKAYNI